METLANFQIQIKEMKVFNNNLGVGEFKFAPEISRSFGKQEGSENEYFLELAFEAKNTQEKPFPMDIYIVIKGIFNLENIVIDERERFIKETGVKTLFPYLRATVTNLTSVALMPPLIVPIIDVYKSFED